MMLTMMAIMNDLLRNFNVTYNTLPLFKVLNPLQPSSKLELSSKAVITAVSTTLFSKIFIILRMTFVIVIVAMLCCFSCCRLGSFFIPFSAFFFVPSPSLLIWLLLISVSAHFFPSPFIFFSLIKGKTLKI